MRNIDVLAVLMSITPGLKVLHARLSSITSSVALDVKSADGAIKAIVSTAVRVVLQGVTVVLAHLPSVLVGLDPSLAACRSLGTTSLTSAPCPSRITPPSHFGHSHISALSVFGTYLRVVWIPLDSGAGTYVLDSVRGESTESSTGIPDES